MCSYWVDTVDSCYLQSAGSYSLNPFDLQCQGGEARLDTFPRNLIKLVPKQEIEIFRISPDRPWGLPSLLYNGYRVFPGGKAAGAWC
jgi:hypothetical protein